MTEVTTKPGPGTMALPRPSLQLGLRVGFPAEWRQPPLPAQFLGGPPVSHVAASLGPHHPSGPALLFFCCHKMPQLLARNRPIISKYTREPGPVSLSPYFAFPDEAFFPSPLLQTKDKDTLIRGDTLAQQQLFTLSPSLS